MFDENFREVAEDAEQTAKLLEQLEAQLLNIEKRIAESPYELGQSERARVSLQIANTARLLGENERALAAYDVVIAHYDAENHARATFITQMKKQLVINETLPQQAIDALSEGLVTLAKDQRLEVYRLFVLEFRARCYFAQKLFTKAIVDLEAALKIAEERDQHLQVRQMKGWIAECKKRQR